MANENRLNFADHGPVRSLRSQANDKIRNAVKYVKEGRAELQAKTTRYANKKLYQSLKRANAEKEEQERNLELVKSWGILESTPSEMNEFSTTMILADRHRREVEYDPVKQREMIKKGNRKSPHFWLGASNLEYRVSVGERGAKYIRPEDFVKDPVKNDFGCYLVACMGNYVNRNETESKGVPIRSVHNEDYNVLLSSQGERVIGILRKLIEDNPGAKIDLTEISKRYDR